jgi:aspartate/methionine/tyrosine aminotransferase
MRNLYNRNLLNVVQSGTVALADKVRKLEAGGRTIIPLHTGDPDFPTPEPIIKAAYEAIRSGFTHYSNSRGLEELRIAISENLISKGSIPYSPSDEILITHGAIHAYYIALSTIAEPGDEFIMQGPTWMTHFNTVRLVGGVPVFAEGRVENNFRVSPDDLESKITSRTKAIIINSPSNPTGGIYTSQELKKIVDITLKHHLYLIADEVYDRILLNEQLEFTSLASFPEIRDRLLLCNSFSKTFAMTGWRIGFLCADNKLISQALKISQCSITNIAPFIQKAALVALTDKSIPASVDSMIKEYRLRANLVMNIAEKYSDSPVRIKMPQGAFYFFVNIAGLNRGNSQITAEMLLDEISVAAVPGSVFGPGGEGYLRLTVAASRDNVLEGFNRLLNLKKLNP